jgi:hypothetical protein
MKWRDENMISFRLYFDKDAEEAWLREMSQNGWAFQKFFLGFYTFEPCNPGEYNYQIDLLDNWSSNKTEYSSFMADLGVEVIGQWWRWVYLRKKAADGPFEMYTDAQSKIALYSKIKAFFQIALIIEVICLAIELSAALRTGSFIFVIFTVLLLAISLALLKIIWKCKWIIEQLKYEK